MEFKDMYQGADWKKEKHVPVIEIKEKLKKNENISILITVGKEIPHPNTTEHHISWIEAYFIPEGNKFPYQLGRFEFCSHGESTLGPNTSGVFTAPQVKFNFKTEKSGTLLVSSYCNIHGLWQNSEAIVINE